ncbi:Regulatory protein cys-3-like protein [Elsinoe fawcettii]|nr:Regulatory protein cys-3-like protein [Elsinoe fawcettii]
MAQYHNRRGPNVSQYIAGLNTITPEMHQQDDFGNFDSGIDLDAFTNADFFDFDLNAPVSEMPNGMQFSGSRQQPSSPANSVATEQPGFVNQPQFFQNHFSQFPQNPTLPGRTSLPPSPPNGVPFAGTLQQSQPTIPSPAHFAAALSPQNQGPQTGEKRKAGVTGTIPNPVELEEQARYHAEEDKRRRNTAASARFRVKKKQREQALEKTAKEMTEKVQILEARIGQLEMENQWLKGLITEKNVTLEGKPGDVVPATTAVKNDKVEDRDDEAAADKSEENMKEDVERTPSDKKRGVGTK